MHISIEGKKLNAKVNAEYDLIKLFGDGSQKKNGKNFWCQNIIKQKTDK